MINGISRPKQEEASKILLTELALLMTFLAIV